MRGAAVVLLGATALSCGAAPAAAAPGDPVTGYWTRTHTGLPVPVQPPDPVPEGGTFVAGDPTGPFAVSALRTDLAPGLLGVELRLTIARAVGTPAVQACPSTDRWAPEQGGRLEAAPVADCSTPLDAKVDGAVLVVPLPPGLDAVNVLLRPKPGAVFSVTMERATAASVVTAPAPAAALPAQGSAAPPATTAAPPPAFSPGVEPALPATPADVAAPLLAAPAPPAGAPALPGPAPQAAPAPRARQATAARAGVAPEQRTPALLATGVLLLLAVQAVRLAAQPAAAPRALGGAARHSRTEPPKVPAVRARGVGRFRTARVRPPVRI